MSDYLVAVEGMKNMLELSKDPMKAFNRHHYAESFNRFYEQQIPAFDAIERLYGSVMEPQAMLENMAQALVDTAVAQVEQSKGRSAKDIAQMNLNMQLAVLIYPSVLHYRGKSSQPLVDTISAKWKEAFPKSNVTPADVETIQNGFKRKFCYISTAVCQELGKPDDCEELMLLRGYRDGYMTSLENGQELIRRYYDVAPTIVKHIDRCPGHREIYHEIWEQYLLPCITMIKQGENEACLDLYMQMVDELKKRFFFAVAS